MYRVVNVLYRIVNYRIERTCTNYHLFFIQNFTVGHDQSHLTIYVLELAVFIDRNVKNESSNQKAKKSTDLFVANCQHTAHHDKYQ